MVIQIKAIASYAPVVLFPFSTASARKLACLLTARVWVRVSPHLIAFDNYVFPRRHLLCVFPRLGPVECFPVLGTGCVFPALGTGHMYSRACLSLINQKVEQTTIIK